MSRQVIGMMEGAFFVPQGEICNWLNSFYGFEITKVEEACTGAIYCQVIESIHRGKVPLYKVNFDARFDYEWVANYKVLQTAFDTLQIQKSIDVQSLIKGKRMDNLEFLQWLKRYFDLNYDGEEYDAVTIREEARTLFYKKKKMAKPPVRSSKSSGGNVSKKSSTSSTSKTASTSTSKTTSTSSSKATSTSSSKATSTSSSKTTSPSTSKTTSPSTSQKARPSSAASSTTKKPRCPSNGDKENKTKTNTAPAAKSENTAKLESEVKNLKEEVTELTGTLESMEKERDFYYAKLREIELMCQKTTDVTPFVQSVQDIMYAE